MGIDAPARLLIDNAWVEPQSGKDRAVIDPATGEEIARVAEAGPEDVVQAVGAARRAFDHGTWPKSAHRQRSSMLHRLADLVEAQAETFADLETRDTGKTLSESRTDVSDVVSVFRYFASLIAVHTGELNSVPASAVSMTVYDPVGVVGMITPWNYPLLQVSWKLAAALAAGCTCVVKPSELAPLTTLKLGETLLEAGLPPGVVNIVTGAGQVAGDALTRDGRVDLVSFTGGIATGRTVARIAADRVAREEIFGPVITVERFESEEEAVRLANGTEYGLAGAVWTTDPARGRRVAGALHLGTVWINDYHPYFPEAPWGGMKQSGVGRELGLLGLHEYLEAKHIYFNLDVGPTGQFGARSESSNQTGRRWALKWKCIRSAR